MEELLEVCSELQIGDNIQFILRFIGKGNIWINNTYEPEVTALARIVVFSALMETAPGQLKVIGYDSDLSGIFAPFASLTSGSSRQMELIRDERELEEQLNYLWQQVGIVQNVIQGRADSLFEFRRRTNRAVEGYTLVVLSLDMGMLKNEVRAQLATLMRVGPVYGFSFLIISTTYMSLSGSNGKVIELTVDDLAPNISVLEVSGQTVELVGRRRSTKVNFLSAEKIIQNCEEFMERVRYARLPVVTFAEIHDLNRMWAESSVDGLSFCVGKWGLSDVDITIGDELNQRHNAIITGAVGQGKSNLISVIIHSLCLRYSPDELSLYLLDFKEGVTFKAFSNIGQETYLPHAKALGLESDIAFGLAVLEELYVIYQRRMKLLKEKNYKSIRELRKNEPELKMPRIVVIIDEFQMMFGEDLQTGQQIVDMLERSVRLFRAAGIHFILASQTLGGNMVLAQKKDAIFGQVPIRIALKNSIAESLQTLSMNNPAAAFLRPREAIINLDYGEVTQNRKSVIAFADEQFLGPIRRNWWKASSNTTEAPYVFEGEKRIFVFDDKQKILERMRERVTPAAAVGQQISISGTPVFLPMEQEPGRNVAIIGSSDSGCNLAVGILQSTAWSLALQHLPGEARFVFCDFNNKSGLSFKERYPAFVKQMRLTGHEVEPVVPAMFENTVSVLLERITGSLIEEQTGNRSDKIETPVYIFGSGMDRWYYEADPYGEGSVLKKLTEKGPAAGIHFFGWWVKASAFSAQVSGLGTTDAFNTKIFLRVDERTVQSMTSPFIHWKSAENRGLVSDEVEFGEEKTFVPYAPFKE